MNSRKNRNFHDAFAKISTGSLEEMLREELSKTTINETAVKTILHELQRRENIECQQCGRSTERAWARYLLERMTWRRDSKHRANRAVRLAPVAIIVVVMLVFLTQEVSASSFFERLIRWNDSFLEIFTPEKRNDNQYEYIFETNNPDLQMVYEQAVELGITGPAVPMWLPEGWELQEIKVDQRGAAIELYVRFSCCGRDLTEKIYIRKEYMPQKFYKSDDPVKEIEIEGVIHSFVVNNDCILNSWKLPSFFLFSTIFGEIIS